MALKLASLVYFGESNGPFKNVLWFNDSCLHLKVILAGDFNSSTLKIIAIHFQINVHFILVNRLKLSVSYVDSDLKIHLCLHLKVLILASDFNSSALKIIAIHVQFKMDKDGISEWHL